VTAAFADWLVSTAAQAAALALVALVADRLLARWGLPHLRAGLWLLVFGKVLCPPGLTSPVGVSVAPASVDPAAATGHGPLLLLWAAGFVCVSGWTIRRRIRLRRAFPGRPIEALPADLHRPLGRAARRIGLRRLPRVALHREARVPCVFGLLRPVVVLPRAAWSALGPREREHVLLHELAHLKRGDLLVDLAVRALGAVYWFHPLLWLAARRIRALREVCCDSTVAAVLREETPEYRRTLLRAAERTLLPAAGMGFLSRSGIVERIRALEGDPWRKRRANRLAAAAVVLVAGFLGLPAAAPPIRGAPTPTAAAPAAAPVKPSCVLGRYRALEWIAANRRSD